MPACWWLVELGLSSVSAEKQINIFKDVVKLRRNCIKIVKHLSLFTDTKCNRNK